MMPRLKKAFLTLMVIVNVVLLAALVHANMTPAQAYPYKTTDYVVMTGKLSGVNTDGLYVIDLASEKLAVWKWDKTAKRLVAFAGSTLPRDFQRAGGGRR
jgi:cell division septal protein FtsQ